MNFKIKDNYLLRTKNENGYKIIKYRLSEMREINTKIKSLGKLSAKLKLESRLTLNQTHLKTKINILNNKSFSLDNIKEELTKVKNQYNKWLNTSLDDKVYQYSNIQYYISNVEYQYYTNIVPDVTQVKSNIKEIYKILDDINSMLYDYKLLNGKEYGNSDLNDLLDNSFKSINNIDTLSDKYLKGGEEILNESYKYK